MFEALRSTVRRWTRRQPLVVATFLVRDERDTIGFNIEHCLDMGVRHVIVTENCSADGTADLLREYERTGSVTLIREPAEVFRQGEWVTRMARMAASRFSADWVFNLDADEFIWSQVGEPAGPQLLSDTLGDVPPDHGYFHLRREDMRVDPGSTASWWLDLNVLRDLDTRSWRSGKPLLAKAVHRADPEVTVADGNHSAHGPQIRQMGDLSSRMVLLHFPDRGYAHYEHKIRVGGAALIAGGTQSGVHWQDDFRRLEQGTLRAAYGERQVTATELPGLLSSRRLVREDQFAKRMAALRARSSIMQSLS